MSDNQESDDLVVESPIKNFLYKINDCLDYVVVIIDFIVRVVRRMNSESEVCLGDRMVVGSFLMIVLGIAYLRLKRFALAIIANQKSLDDIDSLKNAVVLRTAGGPLLQPPARKRNTVLYYKSKLLQSLHSSRRRCVINLRKVFVTTGTDLNMDDLDTDDGDKPNVNRRCSKQVQKVKSKSHTMQPTESRQTIPQYLVDYETDTSETGSVNVARFGDPSETTRRFNSHLINTDVQEILKYVKMFSNFEPKTVEKMLNESIETRQVPNGSHLFKGTSFDENIYVVRAGILQLRVLESRMKVPVKDYLRGECILNVLSIADYMKGKRWKFEEISCKALSTSVVSVIPYSSFCRLLESSHRNLARFCQIVLLRYRRITFMTLHDYFGFNTELMQTTKEQRFSLRDESALCRFEDDSRHTISDQLISGIGGIDRASSDNSHSSGGSEDDIDSDDDATVISERAEQAKTKFIELLNLKDPTILDDSLTVHSISKGTILCREGLPVNHLYFLFEGSVTASCLSTDKRTRDRPIFIVTENTLLGALELMTGETAMFTLRAREKCRLCVMTDKQIERLIKLEPEIILTLTHMEISRLSQFARRMDFTLDCVFIRAKKLAYHHDSMSLDNAYIILNGRVRMISSTSPISANRHVLGEHGRGEVIGFFEQFTETRRQAVAMAVRDTEMIKIPSGLLDYIKFKYSSNFSHFMRITNVLSVPRGGYFSATSNSNLDFSPSDPQFLLPNRNFHTVAVFPVSGEVPIDAFTSALARIVSASGTSAIRLTSDKIGSKKRKGDFGGFHEQNLSAWLSQLEEVYSLVIYQCSHQFDKWTMRCIRQADCILAVALSWLPSDVSDLEKQVEKYTVMAQKELVLLHVLEDQLRPKDTATWRSKRNWVSSHHHIRCPREMFEDKTKEVAGDDGTAQIAADKQPKSSNPDVDLERLARFITGRSVGLVLGGGGAKGCAHVGLIKSMIERNIPIDMIGGTSIGSFVAAIYATDLDIEKCDERAKHFSRQMASYWNKFVDLTYPFVSMFTGRKFNNCLEDVFGDIQIQDLWIPYFCVTTDLSVSKMRTHTTGPIWAFTRASMTLAGYFPPLCDPIDGHLLVDGGYVNNIPADVMRDMGAYLTIAVDVGSQDETDFTNYGESLSGWWMLFNKSLMFWRRSTVKIPSMAEIQSRLAYVSCQRHLELVKTLTRCVYVRPPIDPFGSLDFNSYDDIRNVGYKYGQELFRNQSISSLVESSRLPRVDTIPELGVKSAQLPTSSPPFQQQQQQQSNKTVLTKKTSMVKFVDLAAIVCTVNENEDISEDEDDKNVEFTVSVP